MKNCLKILTVLLLSALSLASYAADTPFFDTSRPEKPVTFGLRVGMNSSGVATNYMDLQPELIQSNFYWHSGYQAGAVAALNIRKFFAVEVGAYWQHRGYDASLMAANAVDDYMGSQFVRVRYNVITIPVTLSWKVNLQSQTVVSFDCGPYFSYGISGKKKLDSYIAFGEDEGQLVFDHTISEPNYFSADSREFLAVQRLDVGVQMGIGFTFFKHYMLGINYMHSLKNIAKNYEGGTDYTLRNCGWNFVMGYNF